MKKIFYRLIALALVGIISAAVIPQVVLNMQQKQIGPILGRAVEQIETGCRNIIELANTNENFNGSVATLLTDFTRTELLGDEYADTDVEFTSDDNFISTMAPYLGIQSYQGTVPAVSGIENASAYNFTKFTALTHLKALKPATQESSVNVLDVYVDANGVAPPNTLGNDVYFFKLRNNCKLIPANDSTREIVTNGFKK